MGQMEILEFLKREYFLDPQKWFSSTDIIEGLKIMGANENTAQRLHYCLMKLATYKLIKFKGIGSWKHKKLFQYKK